MAKGLSGLRLRLRQLRERAERLGIRDRQLRQDLAVDLDARSLESRDQPAVREPVQAGRRVDAGDPEHAELALALLAVAIRVLPAFFDRFAGRLQQLAAAREIAFGLAQNAALALPGGDPAFHSRHFDSPS